ncbi:MAG: hypothetical protein QOD93_1415 [Acetobacteraceae bacterium]|nr:hypothetical protein [Acetobacteraceae bacterium]
MADTTLIKRFSLGGQTDGAAQWEPLFGQTEVALIGNANDRKFKVQVNFRARPQVTFNGHEVMLVYFTSQSTDVGSVIVFQWPADACNRDVSETYDAEALIPLHDIDGIRMKVKDGNPAYTAGKKAAAKDPSLGAGFYAASGAPSGHSLVRAAWRRACRPDVNPEP